MKPPRDEDRTAARDRAVAIGVDLGGTTLRVALIDDHARMLAHDQRPTQADRGPQALIDDLAEMVEPMMRDGPPVAGRSRSGLLGIGVGAPGPLSVREGRIIRMANLPGWEDVPLRDLLQTRLGIAVLLDNDGNMAALGEYWTRRLENQGVPLNRFEFRLDAGARDRQRDRETVAVPRDLSDRWEQDNLVMLTLGTGVGAGIVIDGRVVHGAFENAGELGHLIVVPDGEPCPCGQRGCLERYASARQVVQRVVRAARDGQACALRGALDAGETITASRVAEAARDGDALCGRVWDEACMFLAMACVNIQHFINPRRIVLGGGMSQAGVLLLDAVTDHFRRLTWSIHDDRPAIELSRLGTEAGVIGAAALWLCPSARDGAHE